ncbi:SDR family oxidoreductase [Lentisalinibacter orientalis]|uniref:SDR family oxidoreductase n=1 Tax=Lentisalinibacter orientalis TaxID=2992241 RepID=UPI003868745D
MELNISGRTAIVCGVETDLGDACAAALAREGVHLILPGTDANVLSAAAERYGSSGAEIATVVCDICDSEGRQALLGQWTKPDILINHGAGPRIGDWRGWTREDWLQAIESSMLSAVEMIRLTLDGMVDRGYGRIVNITSQSVKSPMADLDLSNAARAGLTGFVAGVARYPRNADVTINNLLPGLFDTGPLRRYIERQAIEKNMDVTSVSNHILRANPLGRLGKPEEFGALCAFLVSPWAGYINGQNLLIDGGSFRSVL